MPAAPGLGPRPETGSSPAELAPGRPACVPGGGTPYAPPSPRGDRAAQRGTRARPRCAARDAGHTPEVSHACEDGARRPGAHAWGRARGAQPAHGAPAAPMPPRPDEREPRPRAPTAASRSGGSACSAGRGLENGHAGCRAEPRPHAVGAEATAPCVPVPKSRATVTCPVRRAPALLPSCPLQ